MTGLLPPFPPPMPPVAVWGVSAFDLAELLVLAAPTFAGQVRLQVIHDHFDGAVAAIRQRLATEHCDVLVTAGTNAEYLRAHLDIPVVAVRVGGYDVMAALARARQVAGRIALVLHRSVPAEVAQFLQGFGLALELRSYDTEGDARNTVAALAQAGVQVVVGAGLVLRLARQQGLAGVFLYSAASAQQALADAVAQVQARRALQAHGEMLSGVLHHLEEGVVAVDGAGRILASNPAAQAFAGPAAPLAAGRPLAQLFPMLDPVPVLRDGTGDLAALYTMAGQPALVDSAPLREAGRPTGVVFTLRRPAQVEHAFGRLRAGDRSHRARYTLTQAVQASPQMQQVVRRCQVLATRSDATVLLTGPSGVGKELLAQGLHNAGPRRAQPFVAVNCGAVAETLLESEFFGYESGAFTGARRHGKAGYFEAAHRGTLFLDEVAELSPAMQTRLLRVLQEREVTRVGGVAATPVDLRVIAATHRDLLALVREGRFREDLYYRIGVLRIDLPPLSERPQDAQALARQFLAAALREVGEVSELGEGAWLEPQLVALAPVVASHPWPGNARELENLCRRVALAALEQGGPLAAGEVAALLDGAGHGPAAPAAAGPAALELSARRKVLERSHAEAVLALCQGDHAEAARRLGVSRTTLWRKLRA